MFNSIRSARTHCRLLLYLTGTLLLFSLLACNPLTLIDTGSADNELESTVVAMRTTLEALEARQTQPTNTLPPEIVVITATPTQTPIPTPTPSATSTPLPTPPPPPPPTETPAPAPQGRTIVIVVTPTQPPTATPYPDPPVITGPRNDTVVGQGQEIILHWSWNGLLAPGQYFEVKLRPEAQPRSAYIAQELGEGHDFKATVGPGRYEWTVQIVKGYFINNSRHPDDWVFEGFRSPESEPRIIIVADDDDDDDDDHSPPSTAQADPPAPTIPYGLAAGGFVFVVFAVVTRLTGQKENR